MHSASKVRCERNSQWDAARGGADGRAAGGRMVAGNPYRCSGIFLGNSIFAPVHSASLHYVVHYTVHYVVRYIVQYIVTSIFAPMPARTLHTARTLHASEHWTDTGRTPHASQHVHRMQPHTCLLHVHCTRQVLGAARLHVLRQLHDLRRCLTLVGEREAAAGAPYTHVLGYTYTYLS